MNAKTIIDMIRNNRRTMSQHAERLADFTPAFQSHGIETTDNLVDSLMRSNVQGVADVISIINGTNGRNNQVKIIEIDTPKLIETEGGNKS